MVVKRNSYFPKEFLNKLFESIELAKTPGDSIRGIYFDLGVYPRQNERARAALCDRLARPSAPEVHQYLWFILRWGRATVEVMEKYRDEI
jgi:hypothetical protein